MNKDAAFQIRAKRLADQGLRCVVFVLAVELACMAGSRQVQTDYAQ